MSPEEAESVLNSIQLLSKSFDGTLAIIKEQTAELERYRKWRDDALVCGCELPVELVEREMER